MIAAAGGLNENNIRDDRNTPAASPSHPSAVVLGSRVSACCHRCLMTSHVLRVMSSDTDDNNRRPPRRKQTLLFDRRLPVGCAADRLRLSASLFSLESPPATIVWSTQETGCEILDLSFDVLQSVSGLVLLEESDAGHFQSATRRCFFRGSRRRVPGRQSGRRSL